MGLLLIITVTSKKKKDALVWPVPLSGLNIVQLFEPGVFCSVRLQITWDSAA